MVGLEKQYIQCSWRLDSFFLSISVDCFDEPAVGETTKVISDEPVTATEAPPLEDMANKESTNNVPSSGLPTPEPAAKKWCKGKIVYKKVMHMFSSTASSTSVKPLLQENRERERRTWPMESSNLPRNRNRNRTGHTLLEKQCM